MTKRVVGCVQGGAQYLVFNRVLVRAPSPLAMRHGGSAAITAGAHGLSLPTGSLVQNQMFVQPAAWSSHVRWPCAGITPTFRAIR